ncbi:hypothetical protein HERIO_2053 [Hepatospora eriocheir]|uniref:Uncharacterized protein n=1 Tax=Hepatospora eriocheir TaxID=1081669 RepID=A0A1X0Q859_9MICR|nr:hypothetical protein HERIO_2053 [Hepatospora eriocheir]
MTDLFKELLKKMKESNGKSHTSHSYYQSYQCTGGNGRGIAYEKKKEIVNGKEVLNKEQAYKLEDGDFKPINNDEYDQLINEYDNKSYHSLNDK